MGNKENGNNLWLTIAVFVVAIIALWGIFFTGVNEQVLVDGIVAGLAPLMVADEIEPTVEVPEVPEAPAEPEVVEETDYDWEALAWEQVEDEFEDEDRFYSCNGTEYRERDVEFDIEDVSVRTHKNGDVTVTLDVEATCDEDDVRSEREDRTFEIFWDDDDVEDEDWNEAEVKWLRAKVTTA